MKKYVKSANMSNQYYTPTSKEQLIDILDNTPSGGYRYLKEYLLVPDEYIVDVFFNASGKPSMRRMEALEHNTSSTEFHRVKDYIINHMNYHHNFYYHRPDDVDDKLTELKDYLNDLRSTEFTDIRKLSVIKRKRSVLLKYSPIDLNAKDEIDENIDYISTFLNSSDYPYIGQIDFVNYLPTGYHDAYVYWQIFAAK